MKKLQFDIVIDAPRDKVWENIVNDEPYRKWTAPFMPGSFFEGNWGKGTRMRFLVRGENGEVNGMFSEIAECRKPEFISIKHLGLVKNGQEDNESEEAKKWVAGHENYVLTDLGGRTSFRVDMDNVPDEMEKEFADSWPRALALLKELSER
ncbi:SRPBCC domain-containing protein [candidate division WOR-3 bacterium]|nr:SRPBCC domain-containing protein [candidate division WOR-3 bacterium]